MINNDQTEVVKPVIEIVQKSVLKKVLKERKDTSHKGENGRVLVIGGSVDYSGAPILAGLAALRTGVDIVKLAVPEQVGWAAVSHSPDLITKKIKCEHFGPKNASDIIPMLENFDCVLLGPGLGYNKYIVKFVNKLIPKIKVPLIIDADAIRALNGREIKNAIFTPHAKEFEHLTSKALTLDQEANINICQQYAKESIILLKGQTDIIASKDKIMLNKTGNSGMTIGGTGDTLAGLCAGFLAQSKNLFDSACAAAYLNGAVGEHLSKENGYSYTSTDMVKNVSLVLKKLVGN